MSEPNTIIWDRLFKTDPAATKAFVRTGGFKGTAIKPFWCIKRATEEFGPVGSGWGWTVHEDRIEEGAPGVKIWFSKVSVWYFYGGQRRETGQQWGATEFIGKNKNGPFTDEEAAKKSVTDALTKCLSYLGLAGDVHLGQFDDSKYVASLNEEKAASTKAEGAAKKAAAQQKPTTQAKPTGIFLDLGNGDGSHHASVGAYLDALEGALSAADDAGALFDLNSNTLHTLQGKAFAAKTPQGDAVAGRIKAIADNVHAGTVPGLAA